MWSKHLGVWDPQWFVWYQRRGWNRMVQTWCHRCLSIHHISMWLSGGPPRFPKPRPWQGCWGLMGVGGGLWRITMYNYIKYRRRFGRWFCFVLFSNISRFTCVSDDRDMKWVQTYMKLTNVLPWKEWISVIGDIHSAVPNQTHGPWCTDQTTYPLYVNLKVGKIGWGILRAQVANFCHGWNNIRGVGWLEKFLLASFRPRDVLKKDVWF